MQTTTDPLQKPSNGSVYGILAKRRVLSHSFHNTEATISLSRDDTNPP